MVSDYFAGAGGDISGVNVVYANYLYGDGSNISNINISGGSSPITTSGNVTAGNLSSNGSVTANGNINLSGSLNINQNLQWIGTANTLVIGTSGYAGNVYGDLTIHKNVPFIQLLQDDTNYSGYPVISFDLDNWSQKSNNSDVGAFFIQDGNGNLKGGIRYQKSGNSINTLFSNNSAGDVNFRIQSLWFINLFDGSCGITRGALDGRFLFSRYPNHNY